MAGIAETTLKIAIAGIRRTWLAAATHMKISENLEASLVKESHSNQILKLVKPISLNNRP